MKSELLVDKAEYSKIANELSNDRDWVESNFKALNRTRNKLSSAKSNDFLPNFLSEVDDLCKTVEGGFLNDLYTMASQFDQTKEVFEQTDKKLSSNMNEIPSSNMNEIPSRFH
ncbi:MAG: hypothetical protein ACRCUP_05580 [Mycoplasmatales bacterium]